MGQQFGVQIAEVLKHQLDWVPRSRDAWGGGPQGMRLVGQVYGLEVLFDQLAITDTVAHASSPASTTDQNPAGGSWDQVYAPLKSAGVVSTLNEAVTLQPTWSWDGQTYYPFGTAVTVAAGSASTPATEVIALSTPQQYVPFVGLIATCSTAPTSGTLTVVLTRLG